MTLLAVVDVETTGLFPFSNDRILEIGALVVRPNGEVLREFASLVNPGRDVGPTHRHGITASDVASAPRFHELAGELLEVLDGTVAVVGHNVRFDVSFLASEMGRMGERLSDPPTVCTMKLSGGGRLSACCADHGIPVDEPEHDALNDARSAAKLLRALLDDNPLARSEIARLGAFPWPRLGRGAGLSLTRRQARERQKANPVYLERLLLATDGSVPIDADGAEMAYASLLDRVVEDRIVDASESDQLVAMALRWGLSAEGLARVHAAYVDRLAEAALADGRVSEAERRDLALVAQLLGVSEVRLVEALEVANRGRFVRMQPVSAPPLPGPSDLADKRVCFTGESRLRLDGELLSRERATELATAGGLVVADSVTKKLDVLVVSDPNTQSGKATKARRYGIRVMHEPVFWQALGLAVE